ncbi:hypothetical protein Dsin_026622 [Dipteronia sinensis]|uniref:Uncharacterized protein n=1 Tax=Dipteronia sinensis TaxID=43782 RepID=A0AAD9ZYM6_9ROSI|nr:hypothetical protein Dsin_026622 [Dipteronia sinensis]
MFNGLLRLGDRICTQLKLVDLVNYQITSLTLSSEYTNTLRMHFRLIGNPVCIVKGLANTIYRNLALRAFRFHHFNEFVAKLLVFARSDKFSFMKLDNGMFNGLLILGDRICTHLKLVDLVNYQITSLTLSSEYTDTIRCDNLSA